MGSRTHPHGPRPGRRHGHGAPAAGPLPRLRRHPHPAAAALQARRADTTEVIGQALIHKAHGAGFRRISEEMDRPASTVRRWLRRVPDEHVHRLSRRGADRLVLVAAEVFSAIRYAGNLLLYALCLLSAAAVEERRRFGFPDPPWDLIGIYTQGRLLSPPRSG